MNENVMDEQRDKDFYLNGYWKRYYCGNCNNHFEKRIKKGHKAPTVDCEKCSCPVQP